MEREMNPILSQDIMKLRITLKNNYNFSVLFMKHRRAQLAPPPIFHTP